MTTKLIHKSKKWIDPSTTGYIFTEVEFDYSWEAQLKIADCNRITAFDVYISDEKARKKTVKKLNIMIEELMKFRDKIEGIKYEG